MATVIGVRFRTAGKIYYFDPGDKQIGRGVSVIVETARGLEMGTVILPNKEVEDESVVQPLKPVIRIANEEDFAVVKANKEKQKEAYRICQEKIAKHELEMKLVDVEYTFDNNKILFYFTANGRIDFRELVKDLASVFKTRIELRQIGVRDETKLLGGIGICGRALCCHSYLADFVPVSIKMAKEQNLSLNPTKISGVCGRLMCCLKNEEDTYEYLNSQLPANGEEVTVCTLGQTGTVQEVNVLRQRVKVVLADAAGNTEVKEFPVEELRFYNRRLKEMVGPTEMIRPREEAEDSFDLPAPEGGEKAEPAAEDRGNRNGRESNRSHTEKKSRGEGREGREPRENRGRREETGEQPRENREGRQNRGRREENGEQPRENREGRQNRSRREETGEQPRENRGRREETGEQPRENRGRREENGESARSGRGERRNRGHREETGEQPRENREGRQNRSRREETGEQPRENREGRQNRSRREENGESARPGRGERRNRGHREETGEQPRENRSHREESGEQPRENRSHREESGEQPRENRSHRRGRGHREENGEASRENRVERKNQGEKPEGGEDRGHREETGEQPRRRFRSRGRRGGENRSNPTSGAEE